MLRMVMEGRISLREFSGRMKINYRHAKQLKGVVVRDGPRGLVHGNADRMRANAMELGSKQTIVELSRSQYASFNDTHFTEKPVLA